MPSDYVSVSVAARSRHLLYPLGMRQIQRMCSEGLFKTAWKPGGKKLSEWKIMRAEILQHRANNHANPGR